MTDGLTDKPNWPGKGLLPFRAFLLMTVNCARSDVMKSKLFTTINGVFLPFLCIICYGLAEG